MYEPSGILQKKKGGEFIKMHLYINKSQGRTTGDTITEMALGKFSPLLSVLRRNPESRISTIRIWSSVCLCVFSKGGSGEREHLLLGHLIFCIRLHELH